jgi:peroxiredoxin
MSKSLGRGILSIALVAVALTSASGAPGPAPGSPAPDFRLQDTSGKSLRLSSLQGEVVVLHFWATWCPHCLTELPLLDKLAREDSFQGVRILAINLGEPARTVAEYLRSHRLDLTVLLDPRGRVATAYGVLGLPASLVVDSQGRVVKGISMGTLDRAELEAILAPVVGRETKETARK